MIFGNRRINSDLDTQFHSGNPAINCDQIIRVIKIKFRGVLINEKLTWKDQINNVKTNMSRITRVMYRASHVLGTTSLPALYYSLFLPIPCSVLFTKHANLLPSRVNVNIYVNVSIQILSRDAYQLMV